MTSNMPEKHCQSDTFLAYEYVTKKEPTRLRPDPIARNANFPSAHASYAIASLLGRLVNPALLGNRFRPDGNQILYLSPF